MENKNDKQVGEGSQGGETMLPKNRKMHSKGLIWDFVISAMPCLISAVLICTLSAGIALAEEDSKGKDDSNGKGSQVPIGSCQPSNAMSLLAADKQVFSFVPKGSWMAPQNGIGLVNVEPYAVPLTRISTPKPVTSCASNSLTGQTVCNTSDKEVYVYTPPSFFPSTVQDQASGSSLFFGGMCMTCATTIDPLHNLALVSLSLAVPPRTQPSGATSGFQFIDLGTKPTPETAFRSEAPPAFNPGGEISKGVLIDPLRSWILSANESGNYEIVKFRAQNDNDKGDGNDKDKGKGDDKGNGDDKGKGDDKGGNGGNTQLAFYESQFPLSFGSSGEDCRTGIALATVEFSDPSQVYVADLTRAQFTPGPAGAPGTWKAPQTLQTLAGSSFADSGTGPNGIAVAQGTSIGLIIGMVSDYITAIKLPDDSGSGTPAIQDWVTCQIQPGDIDGIAPHTVNAYQSPNTGHAMAVVENLAATKLWRIDLTRMFSLPRKNHVCTSGFLPPDALRTIPVP
jgi:hypothetical protein